MKRPRKPKELENQPGKYDERNTLNDLDGRSWLLLTKSFWESETSQIDKAYRHSILQTATLRYQTDNITAVAILL